MVSVDRAKAVLVLWAEAQKPIRYGDTAHRQYPGCAGYLMGGGGNELATRIPGRRTPEQVEQLASEVDRAMNDLAPLLREIIARKYLDEWPDERIRKQLGLMVGRDHFRALARNAVELMALKLGY